MLKIIIFMTPDLSSYSLLFRSTRAATVRDHRILYRNPPAYTVDHESGNVRSRSPVPSHDHGGRPTRSGRPPRSTGTVATGSVPSAVVMPLRRTAVPPQYRLRRRPARLARHSGRYRARPLPRAPTPCAPARTRSVPARRVAARSFPYPPRPEPATEVAPADVQRAERVSGEVALESTPASATPARPQRRLSRHQPYWR